MGAGYVCAVSVEGGIDSAVSKVCGPVFEAADEWVCGGGAEEGDWVDDEAEGGGACRRDWGVRVELNGVGRCGVRGEIVEYL